MDVRHLELLRELADRGSVTAVAAATHRTPSAVSQQLKAAHREFGVPLVEPAGRGLRLTPAGALLAEGGRDLATTVERIRARWDAFRGEPAGTVRIALLPSAATFLLPDVMRELAGLPIRLQCTDIDIAEAEFGGMTVDHDMVIAHSLTSVAPAGTEAMTVVPLAREPLDIAMSATHPLAGRQAVGPDDLVDAEWIGVPVGYPFDSVLLAIEQRTGRTLHVTQRLRDNRLIESMLRSGRQLAVLPRFTTPTDAGLVLKPLQGMASARHISAVMRPDKAQRLVVRRVLQSFVRVGAETERRHRG